MQKDNIVFKKGLPPSGERKSRGEKSLQAKL